MKIGLLQCDTVRKVLREQGFPDYPEMFMKPFHEVDPELEFRVYRCMDGEIPADAGECDAYITTGSRYSVLDGDAWIRDLERFVALLVDRRIPFIGICFGHQLLAEALGGRVERAKVGWGVGVSENTIESPQPFMNGDELREVNLVVSHQDQVIDVPDSMRVLGGSEFCPNYFCAVGDHALSIQGHPEFSRDYSRALMEMRRGIIPDDVIEAGIASLAMRVDDREVFRWMVRFFERGVARNSRQPGRAGSRA
jgi:GMP synthase (glutamine-hydrolysing)